MKKIILSLFTLVLCISMAAQRSERLIENWEFRRDHNPYAASGWQAVTVPHDWAIAGPFDRSNDLQVVAVVQNGEEEASEKTGRSGGLPYMGKGCYKTLISLSSDELSSGRRAILLFDGAMSEAQVFVNGEQVGYWPYGYNSFYCDITSVASEGLNEVYVLLENLEQSSRWYPGAGLYRKVRLVSVPQVHVPIWGTYITTPYVGSDCAYVKVLTEVEGLNDGDIVTLKTSILDEEGCCVAQKISTVHYIAGEPLAQNITLEKPALWSPESPYLYVAKTEILGGGAIETDWTGRHKITITDGRKPLDCVSTRFGVRSIELRGSQGFYLNGQARKFKGVCLHHDLGPLGAAINSSAIRHQLAMLKEMGCDAIRTSHNMPAEELVQLCDEMGLMLMVEPFDEWDVAKCENGYHRFWGEWAEKDMINMLKHFRNNPSVVMWSIGNEVPSQWAPGGRETASWLLGLVKAYDPTRPVTCGMDQFDAVVNNGFGALLDIPGFNYKPARYGEALKLLPQGVILGSETASTVSSRGVYHFPIECGADILNEDHQSSSYDIEFCSWSNIPDDDFASDEDWGWCLGQFVWTGFDYLGEPSPYDTDAWPNHSSVFGIIDLASIPKDRFYLYKSIWNTSEPTLHVLPHWNWEGREGQTTPVFVYTSYPSAELFINGVSQGVVSKATGFAGVRSGGQGGENAWNEMSRFRLMWKDVAYEAGELKVVAYDADGKVAAEKIVRTAGKPYALKATVDPWNAPAAEPVPSGVGCLVLHGPDDVCTACGGKVYDAIETGSELIYVNVSVVDAEGNFYPTDNRAVNISVSGGGRFKAVANGDPTCLESFQEPTMHLFNSQLTVLVEKNSADPIVVTVSAKGLKKSTLTID